MGIRFSPKANASYYLDLLEKAAEASNGKFDVFTHETMPERYHFAHNERIAPIYIVPRLGYALTNHIENGSGMSKGVSLFKSPNIHRNYRNNVLNFLQNHGYDNEDTAMHAMFVAHGTFPSLVKSLHQSRSEANFLARRLFNSNKGWHSTSDNTYVMDTFQNVEIYNLMMKLLGIEKHAARTNGTTGFWDNYF